MQGSLIKKITRKTVCGDVALPVDAARPLYRVIGIATGVRKGSTAYGDFVGLTGQFEATNIATGEVFVAPQCFLPDPINGMIAAKVQTPDDSGKPVTAQFAVEVGIKPAKTTIGYEFTVREIAEVQEADPLADLRKALPPAPKPDEKDGDKKK